eukprot:jgi/Mesen1/3198/ME000185S02347
MIPSEQEQLQQQQQGGQQASCASSVKEKRRTPPATGRSAVAAGPLLEMEDLPDDVLVRIQELAQGPSRARDVPREAGQVHRAVCNRWRSVVNASATRVSLLAATSATRATKPDLLGALWSFSRTTGVSMRLGGADDRPERKLLQELAKGERLPLVTSYSFEISIAQGRRDLKGLRDFLSHLGSGRLKLSFWNPASADVVPWPDTDEETLTCAQLASLEFRNVVGLEELTMQFHAGTFPTARCASAVAVPLSNSMLALPRLRAFHLDLHDMAQARRLPAWLGRLQAFASLKLTDSQLAQADHEDAAHRVRALHYARGMRSLRALDLQMCRTGLGPTGVATVARLSTLTSLELVTGSVSEPPEGDYEARHGVLTPGLRRLVLCSWQLPDIRVPMPLLKDLKLCISRQSRFQWDWFKFTPALRLLHLELDQTASLSRRASKVRHQQQGCRTFSSYAQIQTGTASRPCRHLNSRVNDDVAWKLFSDARRLRCRQSMDDGGASDAGEPELDPTLRPSLGDGKRVARGRTRGREDGRAQLRGQQMRRSFDG